MNHFVFLPDKRSSKEEVVATLAAVVQTDMALEYLAAPVALGVGMEAVIPSSAQPRRVRGLEVVDVVEQSGAALVKVSRAGPAPEAVGGTFHPVVNYKMAVADVRFGRIRMSGSIGPAGTDFLKIVLRSSANNQPISNTMATLRLKGSRQQLSAVSDGAGVVRFGVRAPGVQGAMLAIEPGFAGHWGCWRPDVSFQSGEVFTLDPIDLTTTPDCLRHFTPPGPAGVGAGVVVAVIDSGVGPHVHLSNVTGDADTSIGHGTHVAGIIAGNGPGGLGGVAPGVSIRSYRVFKDDTTGVAANFEIHRAIEQAVSDGCHLINLSLKVERELDPGHDDKVLSRAIEDAADQGVLIVAAAGNDFRRFVAFPARHQDAIAVSALGWEPGLPADAYDRWTLSTNRGNPDTSVFFASFSNEGVNNTKVDLVAAGAGVVSTVPGNQYAPMSGTSMACPAVTGAIAKIFAANNPVLAMAPDRARYQAMRQLAFANLRQVGFGVSREGSGMI